MTKTSQQEAATNYANDFLDRLLEREVVKLRHRINKEKPENETFNKK